MEVIGAHQAFDLDQQADIGTVRRTFTALATEAGLDATRVGEAALIATELTTNVVRHAQHGGALISNAYDGDRRGVAIAAWDRGPGMNLVDCLRDGMSTGGTAGLGLGAISRLASHWDAYTPHGRGSVVVATVFPRARDIATTFSLGVVSVPYPGQVRCGDACDAVHDGDRLTLIGVDGLGHGDGAADAAAAVLAAFRAGPNDPLATILERADRAAKSTRGAAATVVRLDLAARTATIAGVGNVMAWIIGDTQRQLVTQHGTLGQATPRLREEPYPFPQGSLLVMHSDGLKTRWTLADHPGLVGHEPTTIASVLWRDLTRGRDDATIAVVRGMR